MEKQELIKYLDEYLKINDFKDNSKNWLQVDNCNSEIKKIGYSVDASTYIFDKARNEDVDLVLCHHGMFWWYENVLVWVPFERAKKLIENNIALYACHLPLDAHSEVWNNIWLLKWFVNIFWLSSSVIPAEVPGRQYPCGTGIYENYSIESFWNWHELDIWFALRFKNKVHISSLQTIYAETLQLQKKLYNFGNKDFIQSIAFGSWWWWSWIKEAKEKWFDLFLTWEAVHHEILWAKELGQSIMLAWHRETEKIWPKLLAYHLRDKFWIEIVFLDEKY